MNVTLDMIPMTEFLDKVARPGLLKLPLPAKLASKKFCESKNINNQYSLSIIFVVYLYVCISMSVANKPWSIDALWKYIESVAHVRSWQPGKMFIGFNLSTDVSGKPVFGDIPLSVYTKKFASHDRKLVVYDEQFHSERVVFFPGDYRDTHRILTHFYSYIFFANPQVEHIIKRMVSAIY